MEDQIKLIAQRLRGMREALDISPEEAAQTCAVSLAIYNSYETGTVDIPVSVLHRMAHNYNFELATLIAGEEPHLRSYSLTRKNKGAVVERTAAYKYKALGNAFLHRKAEPFLVTVEPKADEELNFNTHPGQEFNYMIEGRMKFVLGEKEMILEAGDSIYFDSGLPHGMLALDNKPAQFLAIIL